MSKQELKTFIKISQQLEKTAFLPALARIGMSIGKGAISAVKSYPLTFGLTAISSAAQQDPNDPNKSFFERLGERLKDPRTYLAAGAFSAGYPVLKGGVRVGGKLLQATNLPVLRQLGTAARIFGGDERFAQAVGKVYARAGDTSPSILKVLTMNEKGLNLASKFEKVMNRAAKIGETPADTAKRLGWGVTTKTGFKPYFTSDKNMYMLTDPFLFGFGTLATANIPVLNMPQKILHKISDPETYGRDNPSRIHQWYNY